MTPSLSGPSADGSTTMTSRGGLEMRRQRWLLLIAALACLGSLLLWIAEIDVGIEESLPSQAPVAAPSNP